MLGTVRSESALTLRADGASDEELARGLAAARAVIEAAATTPLAAASARFTRDCEMEELTDEENRICCVWDDAEEAALAACCPGRPEAEGSCLELTYDPDTLAALRHAELGVRASGWDAR